ncbi:hypothetical protein [Mycolicibacterium sp.]|uniref:hypothetical protein n=1 Tax=Mycolicibacterium sp. TaxID=2320850 RepID=UPI0025D31242|nr:hypothetical protein [Mycolicibacterium sp.]
MTQPTTGTTWNGAGLADLGPEFLERGNPLQVLSRDHRGQATDISPHNSDGSVRWSPFAQNNRWRGDLLARRKQNGYWVTVTDENQGFLSLGAFKDGTGVNNKPGVRNDQFRIIQNNFPYHTALTEESESFSFAPVDTGNPAVQHLRKNLRLSDANGNIIIPDPGQSDAGYSRIVGGGNPGRQFLVCRELNTNVSGLPIYKVDGYSLARLMDIGNSKKDKKESEAAELSYDPELDGIMMAMAYNDQGLLEYQPVLMHTWYGGPGWTALGGIPQLSATAPVATAGASGLATLAFAVPTGTGDPWEYTAQASTDGGVTWGLAITPDSVTVSGGTVTLHLDGLTAGSTKLRATVTGTNGATATTPNSNTITVAGS